MHIFHKKRLICSPPPRTQIVISCTGTFNMACLLFLIFVQTSRGRLRISRSATCMPSTASSPGSRRRTTEVAKSKVDDSADLERGRSALRNVTFEDKLIRTIFLALKNTRRNTADADLLSDLLNSLDLCSRDFRIRRRALRRGKFLLGEGSGRRHRHGAHRQGPDAGKEVQLPRKGGERVRSRTADRDRQVGARKESVRFVRWRLFL